MEQQQEWSAPQVEAVSEVAVAAGQGIAPDVPSSLPDIAG